MQYKSSEIKIHSTAEGLVARINIEDSIYKDQRWFDLLMKTGDADKAMGSLVRAWMLAQKWYLTPSKSIPMKEWRDQKLSDTLIEVGLAEVIDGKVRMRGIDEQFAWLKQRSESGKKGGPIASKIRVENKGKSKRRKSSENNETQPPSLSPDPSPSTYSEAFLFHKNGESADTDRQIKSPIGFFIANYVNAYQYRYGTEARPLLSGKIQGQIKQFLRETPIDRACELIQTFLSMNDRWFVQKAHDFSTFIQNLSQVSLKLDTGKSVTQTEARHLDQHEAVKNQLDRIAKGEL